MPDDISVASSVTEGSQGAGVVQPTSVDPSAAGGVQPGAVGGGLPEDVHPAVREERARSAGYRRTLEQLVELDAQGQVVGLRPEIVDHVLQSQGRQAPAPVTAAPAGDAFQARVAELAERTGLLPQQVEPLLLAAYAIAKDAANEAAEPAMFQSIESLKAGLVASNEVPREAAADVARWMDTARKANPRAVLTPQGRETVLRQAIGDWYLRQVRAGRNPVSGPAGAAASAPTLMRPGSGTVGGPGPSIDEAGIRAKFGLPTGYTKFTPVGEEAR